MGALMQDEAAAAVGRRSRKAGVGVVTMSGDRHASRVGASIMTHVGLEKFIAKDTREYVNLAIEYANNTSYLVDLRTKLRSQVVNSTLCDSKGFARSVEQTYRNMWNQHVINSSK